MKLDGLNLNSFIQTPVQANVRNNVSNALENDVPETAPTQIDSCDAGRNIPSAASNPIDNKKASETLKAQVLAQAPISYTYIRDIKLPFSNNAKLFRLANGQKVVILEKKGPTVLETYYNVGSMNEPDEKRGISHFNEHMAFNGSKSPYGSLNSGDFFRIVNEMGASTNASTGFSATNYFISSQLLGKGNVFDTSAYIQSQQLQYPEPTADMIEKEKGPVTSEISMVGDDPVNTALNNCIKNLFQIQSTSPDLVAGTISNINKLTRKDTLDYYNLWYTPDNSVTVVTGEVPVDEAINTIAKYFNKSAYVPVQNRKYQDFNVIQKPVRVDVKLPKAQSGVVVLGFAGPANNSTKENIEMEVLMTSILGYKNARISKELNKIQSAAMMNIERVGNRPSDPKTILLASQTTPQKTEEVIKTIYQGINNLVQNPITQEELDTAKKFLKMTYSKISEESHALNSLLGNAILDNDLNYAENYLAILDSLTPADITNFARKYLDLNKVSLSVVHPQNLDDSQIMANYETTNNISNIKKSALQNPIQKIAFKGRIDDKLFDTSKIKQYKLANNMQVILNPNKSDISTSYIKLQTVMPAQTKPGVPSILSIMLNEGSKNKNYDEFYKDVYKAGMSLKFDAGYDFICADSASLAQDTGMAVDLIKEVLTQPRFNEKSLAYAKKLFKESLLKVDNTANEPLVKDLFPDYSKFSTREELLNALDSITLSDVENFYNYIKDNAMAKAVFTAPVDKKPELAGTVLNKFSYGIGEFKPYKVDYFKNYTPIPQNKILTKAEPRNQAEILQAFKFKTNYNPKDQMVFSVLNTILGGGPSSRLFEDLREKQKLAYRVESEIDYEGDTGIISLGIKTTTDNPGENIEQFDNVEKSLDGFKKHIELLKTQPVSQEELEAAKLKAKTTMLNRLETSDEQTGMLAGSIDTYFGINAINENLKIIDEITAEDIQNAANYIFNSNCVISILASQKTLDNMNINNKV